MEDPKKKKTGVAITVAVGKPKPAPDDDEDDGPMPPGMSRPPKAMAADGPPIPGMMSASAPGGAAPSDDDDDSAPGGGGMSPDGKKIPGPDDAIIRENEHCKDCKHYDSIQGTCEIWAGPWAPEDACKEYFEPKKGDDEPDADDMGGPPDDDDDDMGGDNG